jgi:general secretion pathway protein E
VSGVMAQRLVRKLCRACARHHPKGHGLDEKFRMALPAAKTKDLSRVCEAVGCEACGGTGYSGRTTVCELLVVDDAMREAIGRRSQDQRAMEQLARSGGFRTLYEDGIEKVIAGETTLEEVLRVTRVS